jgi:hypothetical protein
MTTARKSMPKKFTKRRGTQRSSRNIGVVLNEEGEELSFHTQNAQTQNRVERIANQF